MKIAEIFSLGHGGYGGRGGHYGGRGYYGGRGFGRGRDRNEGGLINIDLGGGRD